MPTMMVQRYRGLMALLALSVALVAFGIACGGDDQPKKASIPADKPAATAKPVAPPGPSGSITIAVAGISPLIQNQRRDISAVGGFGRSLSVWEPIVRAPFVAPPAPPPMQNYTADDNGLASSWEVASDELSITFEIRDNIPWHNNGGDWGFVTAEDVAWSFNEAFAPDSVNNGAEEIGPEMKVGFDVVGPLTVKQNIEAGGFDPTWMWLMGNAAFSGIVITNKAAHEKLGAEKYAETPIGTGKYRVIEWVGNEKIVTEALNEHWTGIVPHVKNITVVEMVEPATRDAALRAGEIDIGELPATIISSTVDAIGGRIQEIGIPRPQGFQMAGNYWSTDCSDCEGGQMPRPAYDEAIKNPDKFPWVGEVGNAESMESARLVRQAMAMAIDRESLVEDILDGHGRVIYAWQNILPGDPSHKDKWNISFDVAKAKDLLAEAGYADGFSYTLWTHGTAEAGSSRAAADAVVEMWRQNLGLDGTVDRTAYGIRRPETVDKTINDPFLHGINWIPGSTSARYICANPGHIVGFTMEQHICDIGLANANEKSLDKRIANNIEVQDYLSHQMLFIPMFQVSAILYAVGPDIAEWRPYNQQDVFVNHVESITLK